MKKMGRPSKRDDITVKKLEDAFLIGASVAEACFVAGITKTTFYNWADADPDFLDRMHSLQESTAYAARKVVRDAIDSGDEQTARWYLERKKKAEFGTRQELTGAEGGDIGVAIKTVNRVIVDRADD